MAKVVFAGDHTDSGSVTLTMCEAYPPPAVRARYQPPTRLNRRMGPYVLSAFEIRTNNGRTLHHLAAYMYSVVLSLRSTSRKT